MAEQSPDQSLPSRLQIDLTPTQAAALDDFQRTEKLQSRVEALGLLLEIGIETVTSSGQRFWDKPFSNMRDIYLSSNGDKWQLLHDPVSGRMLVRHTPNTASGGQVRETSLEGFLNGGDGPQHQALRAMLNGADADATLPEMPLHARRSS